MDVLNPKYIENFALELSKGNIPSHSGVNKFGFNDAVGTSFETIWTVGGLYTWLDSAQLLVVVGSDVGDDIDVPAGGAHTIEIEGLDVNYNIISETITMQGLTPVPTVNAYIRVHRARVTTAGDAGGTIGSILIQDIPRVISVLEISPTYDNQSLLTLYTVPAGYTAYMNKVIFSTGKAKEVFCSLNVRPFGGVFNIKHSVQIRENISTREFTPCIKIEEKSDIEARAVNLNSGSVEISCEFDLILVKN